MDYATLKLVHQSAVTLSIAGFFARGWGSLAGAAAVMAHDLGRGAESGLFTQLCGDCHLNNFGGYASPERELLFGINDFDETFPAPWEWDVKRLAASFVIASPQARAELDRKDFLSLNVWHDDWWRPATESGYLTIENRGSAADRLVSVSGDIAGRIELHEMAMDDGVMKMRPLEKGLTIEPGKTVKLAPGGNHVMMLDLKAPLKQGDKVPLTLDFEKAGKVAVSLDVQAVGAQAPGGGGQSMDKSRDHSGMKK